MGRRLSFRVGPWGVDCRFESPEGIVCDSVVGFDDGIKMHVGSEAIEGTSEKKLSCEIDATDEIEDEPRMESSAAA